VADTKWSRMVTDGQIEELLTHLRELLDRWAERVELEDEIMDLLRRALCPRCSQPAPPPPRWKGDPWARDRRGPHSCGRSA